MIVKPLNTVRTDKIKAIVSRKEVGQVLSDYCSNTVLISISDPGGNLIPDTICKNYYDVHHVSFWDITVPTATHDIINYQQAKEIYDFILKHKDKMFVVHCEAGISRSSGVGCAIECLLNYGGDLYAYSTGWSDVKKHRRYHPNLTVYDTIVGVSDEKEI